MPRINSALYGKPKTRDRKKWQTEFDYEPDVLTRAKIRQAVKDLEKAADSTDPPDWWMLPPEIVDLAKNISENMATTIDALVTATSWSEDEATKFDTEEL